MKAEVKILVEYNPTDDHVLLSSREVEGDGLPLNIHIGVLQALSRMQEQYNGRQLEIALTPPSEISIASEVPERPSCIGVPAVSKEETSTPPTQKTVVSVPSKKTKRYTVEEKTEIAMMYASGMPVSTIAEKFGREPQAIRLLIYKLGVKRGDNPVDPEQADDSKPASKQGSVLKNKPWYLKK